MKKLSVLICNGTDVWPTKTLDSLLTELMAETDEIIIVGKNYSLDQNELINHVYSADIRANIKRNLAAVNSKGEYLFFVDDDVVLGLGWRLEIENAISQNIAFGYSQLSVGYDKVLNTPNENGALIRKETFSQLLFDVEMGPGAIYASSEILDLTLRYKALTGQVPKLIGVNVYHPELNDENNYKKVLTYSLGNGYVLKKHAKYRLFILEIIKTLFRIFFPRSSKRKFYLVRLFALLAGFLSYE